ncbi:MAG: hypothetical protein K8R54_09030 [Bacteroidales bacterium]|nr:hypothetical protein [Bacteroidales bacterium]
MKTNYLQLMVFLMVIAVSIGACKKDNVVEPEDNEDDIIKSYSGSGSEGDLVTFEINHTDGSYTIHNETTGEDESGNYTIITDNDLTGIYEINIGASNFYAVELDDKIIAANFPTGNPNNNISVGVSSSIDNSSNMNNIHGNYAYIIMDNDGIMDDPKIKEWGILNVKDDNTWIKKGYATNTGDGSIPELSPDQYAGTLPITSGDETGTWVVNGENKERLDVSIDGSSESLSGFVYADVEEAAFLLDLGAGNGFLIGLRITDNSSFSIIADDYKFINVWDNGYGAGNYSISNTGVVNWVHQGSDGSSDGNFQLTQCTNVLNNFFYCNNVDLGDDYFESIYCIVVGDIILQFGFDNSNGDFAQYGIGAKIN